MNTIEQRLIDAGRRFSEQLQRLIDDADATEDPEQKRAFIFMAQRLSGDVTRVLNRAVCEYDTRRSHNLPMPEAVR